MMLASDRARCPRLAHDDPPARQALADIVVGVADQLQGHATREERAEALARRAGQADVDRAVGQAGVAVAPGDLARQHGADGAVDVAHGLSIRTGSPPARAVSASAISSRSSALPSPWSCARCSTGRAACRPARRGARATDRCRTPSSARRPARHRDADLADHLLDGAEAQPRHDRAQLLGDEEEVVDDVLGLAGELGAQHRVLRRDADRAGVEVALAHHDAAGGDQRRGGEAELVRAQQSGDRDVATGAQAAVGLDRDAVAQAVEQQGLLRFRQPDLPRRARVGQRGQRRSRRCRLRNRRWSRDPPAPWRRRPRPCRRPPPTPASRRCAPPD